MPPLLAALRPVGFSQAAVLKTFPSEWHRLIVYFGKPTAADRETCREPGFAFPPGSRRAGYPESDLSARAQGTG